MVRPLKLISSEPVVKAVGVTRIYQTGSFTLTALQNINISIERGSFMGIAGPSGSGKTTLLNLLGCIDRPDSGDVIVQGVPTRFLNDNQLSDFRAKKIGFIFQTFNLIPTLSALENVQYPLQITGVRGKACRDLATHALAVVGLEKFITHRPNQLSGGQRQRVAIARAIVKKPSVILADEPTANLDRKTATEILNLLQDLNENGKITFVFSSHDPLVLERMNSVMSIHEGVLTEAKEVRLVA